MLIFLNFRRIETEIEKKIRKHRQLEIDILKYHTINMIDKKNDVPCNE